MVTLITSAAAFHIEVSENILTRYRREFKINTFAKPFQNQLRHVWLLERIPKKVGSSWTFCMYLMAVDNGIYYLLVRPILGHPIPACQSLLFTVFTNNVVHLRHDFELCTQKGLKE